MSFQLISFSQYAQKIILSDSFKKEKINKFEQDIFNELLQSPFESIEIEPIMLNCFSSFQSNEPQIIELDNESLIQRSQDKQTFPVAILKKRVIKKKVNRNNETFKTIEQHCKCTKSQCQKQYCECFTLGRKCNLQCQCHNCGNQDDQKHDSVKLSRKAQNFCTCKRSNCIKRYCECYLKGRICNKDCKCFDCGNCKTDKQQKQIKGELTGNILQNLKLVNKINRFRSQEQ